MEYASKFFIVDLPDFTGEILALSQKVEEYGRDEYIDGQILASALKFVFWSALKRSEFPILKIGHVKCQQTGEIVSGIEIGHREVEICEDLKILIQNHLAYLKNSGYKTTRAQPLFPKTRKSSLRNSSDDKNRFYDDGTMSSHIKTCLEDTGFSFKGFESIRQAGICSYFIRSKESGEFNPEECLHETTSFARYSNPKEVIRIIKQFIQPENGGNPSIYDAIPKLSLIPFIDRIWFLPYLYYEYCIKYFHGKRFNNRQYIIPYGIVLGINALPQIRQNFFLSLDKHPELTTSQKDYLKRYFIDTINERFGILFSDLGQYLD